jgi:PAS domain S-box-containing protein
VESSDDAIFSTDLSGLITSWNRASGNVFGYTAEEVVGQPVVIFMPPDRADEEAGVLERIRSGERVDHRETIWRRKDGTLIEISLSVLPIYAPDGTLIGASQIARDVSNRKRSEIELSRLAAIVESSADAIISKDLNGEIKSWNAGA